MVNQPGMKTFRASGKAGGSQQKEWHCWQQREKYTDHSAHDGKPAAADQYPAQYPALCLVVNQSRIILQHGSSTPLREEDTRFVNAYRQRGLIARQNQMLLSIA
jgi:hypothetical protein